MSSKLAKVLPVVLASVVAAGGLLPAARCLSATDTETPTESPTPTESSSPTESASPSPSRSPTPTPTDSPTFSLSPTYSLSPTPGPAPTGLQALCGDRTVYLSWNASGYAAFNVVRDSSRVNSQPVSALNYQDTSLTNLTTYNYEIRAADSLGNDISLPAAIQAEPAPAPYPAVNPGISVSQELGKNRLMVQAAVMAPGGSPSYTLIRSADGGNSFMDLSGSVTDSAPFSFDDATIDPGTQYWYSVRVSDGRSPCASTGLYPVILVPPLDYRLALSRNRLNPNLGEKVSVSLSLLEPSRVRCVIFTPAGLRVLVLVEGDLPAGEKVLSWDGRNDKGSLVAPGIYIFHAEIKGSGPAHSLTGQVGVIY